MDIHITQLLKVLSQRQVGGILGVTQGAVHQMVRKKRDIYFRSQPDGSYQFYEIKNPIKKKSA